MLRELESAAWRLVRKAAKSPELDGRSGAAW